MDQETLRLLEFHEVLQIIAKSAETVYGRLSVQSVRPLPSLEQIRDRLALLEETIRYLAANDRIQGHHLADIDPLLSSLQEEDAVLQPAEILAVTDHFETGQMLRQHLNVVEWPLLHHEIRDLEDASLLVQLVRRSITEAGEISEGAYPELREARRKQTEARDQLQSHLDSFLDGPSAKLLIPEPFITQRAGRFVLPVRIERQHELTGIVHDTSSSGATVFMEPVSSIELNNRYTYYCQREAEIIHKVLRELTEAIRAHLGQLQRIVRCLGVVDAVFSIATFASQFHCTVPEFGADKEIRLVNARHPLLIATLGHERVTPVSLELGGNHSVLVISGPNTGGKTVALKTAGLLTLLAHSGLPLPASEAHIPFLGRILADIGDHQSISLSLSTFSAHVGRINEIISSFSPGSLILLDEIGRGTDPADGAALAMGIIEHFRRNDALVIVTTHHRAVKSFAASSPGVQNASVTLDPVTQEPNFRLELGLAGSSGGLATASRLGLPESIIKAARAYMDPREVQIDKYLEEMQRALQAIKAKEEEQELRLSEFESLRADLQETARKNEMRRQKEFEANVQQWAKEYKARLDGWASQFAEKQRAQHFREEARRKESFLKEHFRRKFKEQLKPVEPVKPGSPTSLREGDRAFHPFFQKYGIVMSVEEDGVLLEIEGKRVKAGFQDIRTASGSEPVQKALKNVTIHAVEEAEPELKVIGLTVEDALELVDKYLDRAFLSRLQEVRVIHGFGTGRLKRALAEFLASHPHVEAHHVEGGTTVVRIRH